MLIIGLGNPGDTYDKTLHNAGFSVADRLAELMGIRFKDKECKALTGSAYKDGERIVIAKPQTYMNLSGEAVRELMGRYREDAAGLLIVYDDIDIDTGVIRVRREGSAGTHNGMRNIIALLGRQDFARVRIGVGRPPKDFPLADYVLSRPHGEAADKLNAAYDKAAAIIRDYVLHRDIDRLMRESK